MPAPNARAEGVSEAAAAFAHTSADPYRPGAKARALLRGIQIARHDLQESGGAFDLSQVTELLGISRQAVDKKVKDDALLAVPGPNGQRRYPVAQFTEEGVVPGLRQVLAALPSRNAWFRLNFLVNPDPHLDRRRPIDLLKAGQAALVVQAAGCVGQQGA